MNAHGISYPRVKIAAAERTRSRAGFGMADQMLACGTMVRFERSKGPEATVGFPWFVTERMRSVHRGVASRTRMRLATPPF